MEEGTTLLLSGRLKRTISTLLALLLLAAMLVPAAAAKTKDEKVDYLALGNSLAAGQTPYREIDDGYTDFLADKLDRIGYLKSYSNRFAVPGYTTEDVLEDIQDDVEKDGESIRESIEEAEIITLDAGANDLLKEMDFSPSGVSIDPAKIPVVMDQVSRNLKEILEEIDDLNPDADVYVMGYYNSFPYLPADQQQQLLPVLHLLNKNIAKVTLKAKATYVPTADAIAEDFQTYLPNPADIHLSKEGYQVLANEFWDKLKGKFPVKKLSVNKQSVTLQKGKKLELTLTALYPNGKNVNVNDLADWKSSNKSIVTVKDGVITARKKGTAVITARYEDKKVSITVKVKE
jgi:lysophospholipase L1-like esterase